MTALEGATVRPYGETAVVLEYGDRIDPDLHDRVLALDRALAATPLDGVEEVVPSYRSVLVRFDPLRTDPATVVAGLERLEPTAAATATRTIEVPFDPAAGEDLEEVAARAGLADPAAVVAALTANDLRVYLHGFAPGFAYLGGLPAALRVPRRATPRAPVDPGSVLVAAGQAALCPVAMPTGWWVVGHTDVPLFDATASPPVPFGPGDHVRLRAV